MGKIMTFLESSGIKLAVEPRRKMIAFDRELEDLEAKVQTLQSENLQLRAAVNPLRKEVEALKEDIERAKELQAKGGAGHEKPLADNPNGYRCDHCGSADLQRTGNRPNPTFKDLGGKDAVFCCLRCGKESAFLIEPR